MERPAVAAIVSLRRSAFDRAWVAMLVAATLGVALALPLDRPWHALVPVVPLAWALVRWIVLRRSRLVALAVDLERRVRTVDARGVVHEGTLAASSYVGSRIVTVVWRPRGARCLRAAWMLPDMLPAEDARRLRVVLRYGQSGAAPPSPRSQA